MKSYAIVVFLEGGDVAMVPKSWCVGEDNCWWPPYKSPLRFEKAIRFFEPPNQQTWKMFGIRILSVADSYEKARKRLTRAEDTSDLQTEAEEDGAGQKRKRRANPRYYSSSSDDGADDDGADDDGGDDDGGDDDGGDDDDGDDNGPDNGGHDYSRPTNFAAPSTPTAQSCPKKRLAPPPSVPTPLSLPSGSEIVGRTTPVSSRGQTPLNSSTHVTAAQRMILKLLTELKGEVKELKMAVQHIQQIQQHQGQASEPGGDFVFPEGIVLPVTDLAALHRLEEELKTNKALQNHLISTLSERGGHNLRDVVRRMSRSLISNSVASQLNWTGIGQKTGFRDLGIRTIFEKAVRRTSKTSSCTDAEVKEEVIHYLKGACDRDGG